MPNHPNRLRSGAPLRNHPAPEEIRRLREEAGLTQTEAADMVCVSLRNWQQWEAGDRRMHPGLWMLFFRSSKTHRSIQRMNKIATPAEKVSIEITRYKDNDGYPTCAADFASGKVCPFYMTQRLGCRETCVFADKTGKYWLPLQRRLDGAGTLIPLPDCPVWGEGATA